MQARFPVMLEISKKKSVFISMCQNVQKWDRGRGGSLIFVCLTFQKRGVRPRK